MIQSIYHESRLDGRSWINHQTSHQSYDRFDQLKSNYDFYRDSFPSIILLWPWILELSLSNVIGLLLSIKVDRSHFDAHPNSYNRPTIANIHYKGSLRPMYYSIEIITDDWIEIQMISRMVMLSTSYSLTTICTRHSVSLHCRLEIHWYDRDIVIKTPWLSIQFWLQ